MTIKTYVIGAGVTGLSFAKAYRGEATILEAADELGGKALSYQTDTPVGTFGFDIGGHWFHYKNTPEVLRLLEGLELEQHNRKAYVHMSGQNLEYPIQQSYIRHSDGEFVDRVKRELLAVQAHTGYSNYQEMLLKSYGPALYQAFFKNYNCKMYGVEDLTTIGVSRLETVRNVRTQHDVSGYNADFLYPQGAQGAQGIPVFLSQSLQIQYSRKVSSINLKHKTMVINGETVSWDTLVSTMPLNSLVHMISDIHPRIHDLAGELKSSRGLILNLGVKRTPLHGDTTWIYYPDPSLCFYRVGFYSNVQPLLAPQGYSSMYVECSPLWFRNRVEAISMVPRVIEQLVSAGLVGEEKDIVTRRAIYLSHNYCLPAPKITNMIHQYLAKAGIYSIGRYGTWHWSSQHEDMQQAMELAKQISL